MAVVSLGAFSYFQYFHDYNRALQTEGEFSNSNMVIFTKEA